MDLVPDHFYVASFLFCGYSSFLNLSMDTNFLFCFSLPLFCMVSAFLFTFDSLSCCDWGCLDAVHLWGNRELYVVLELGFVAEWERTELAGCCATPASDVRGRVCGTGAVPPCVGVSLHLRRLWVQGTLCFCLFVCLLPFSSGIGRNTCASRTILYDNPPEMFAVQQFLQVSSLWKSYMFGVKNFLLFFQTRWECVDDLLPYHH